MHYSNTVLPNRYKEPKTGCITDAIAFTGDNYHVVEEFIKSRSISSYISHSGSYISVIGIGKDSVTFWMRVYVGEFLCFDTQATKTFFIKSPRDFHMNFIPDLQGPGHGPIIKWAILKSRVFRRPATN